MKSRILRFFATVALFLTSTAFCGIDAARPNILFILADDLGYECIGANGGESYTTPNLDALAASGMRFDHAYAPPLCPPTRVQLMTGQSSAGNYGDGRFFDMAVDPAEKSPLDTKGLEDTALSARAQLASVLSAFRDARPKSLRGTESTSLPLRSTSRLLSSSQ